MLRSFVQVRRHTTVAFRNIWSPETKVITQPYSKGGPQAWITELWSQKRLGFMELDPTVFSIRPRLDIIYEVVRWHKECLRHGAESSRRRSDMGYTGKKAFRNSGFGRARRGDASAPHLKTGRGVEANGLKPHDRSYNVPMKVRQLAMRSAVSMRYAQDCLYIVDDLSIPNINVKKVDLLMKSHGWKSVLFVREEPSWKAYLDGSFMDSYRKYWDGFMEKASGVDGVKCVTMNEMTTHAIMKHKGLVMTAAVARALEEQLHFV